MPSPVRNSLALAETALALAGSVAVPGPAHADARGTQPTAARHSRDPLRPVSNGIST
ncbi:hypothetical protein [Streptomyces sp. NPDC001401]|uniref:hypothetical protein n=1 Tax=Streptomyces sp. NPDC001401 TaxID=3364570 RepID=UPI0036CFA513